MDATGRASELTIVTVCIEKHFDYVRQQIELIEALNPGARWRILVVDNSRTDQPSFQLEHPRSEVIPGVEFPQALPPNFRGSYHHAAALNLAIRRVATRWALVLDPDLFVLYRDWINESIEHMSRHGLSFFGVPWHYRWYNKYRYFPCVHFLLIDLSRVEADRLDFMPGIAEAPEPKPWPAFARTPQLAIRWRIGSSRDTGWKLWRDFGRTGRHKAEVALPVVDIETELQKPSFLATRQGRRLERWLPRDLSLLPSPGSYLDPKQAPGFHGPEIRALAPEMFVWRGAPFAVHLRRHVRDTVIGTSTQADEALALGPLLKNVKASRLWTSWAFSNPGQPSARIA